MSVTDTVELHPPALTNRTLVYWFPPIGHEFPIRGLSTVEKVQFSVDRDTPLWTDTTHYTG